MCCTLPSTHQDSCSAVRQGDHGLWLYPFVTLLTNAALQNWETPHRSVLYHCDPWTMEVRHNRMKFSVSVSVTRYGPNKTLYMSLWVLIKECIQNGVSCSYVHAIFELVEHEESEIWTSLLHSFTKGGLLQLPG